MQVSPFRDPRIKVCLQLPEAFRSLLRLSSASGAKAFPTCPLYLNLINPLLRFFLTFFFSLPLFSCFAACSNVSVLFYFLRAPTASWGTVVFRRVLFVQRVLSLCLAPINRAREVFQFFQKFRFVVMTGYVVFLFVLFLLETCSVRLSRGMVSLERR